MVKRLPDPRTELASIGEDLVEMAADRRPINVKRLGDLFVRLAAVYSRGVNAQDHAKRK